MRQQICALMVLLVAIAGAAAEWPQGLVLHFSCDELRGGSGGTTLPDVTGSNNNGRVTGVKGAAAGRLGAACEFTGKNSFIQVPDSPALNSKRVTVCMWFKTGKIEGEERMLVNKNADSGYALSLTGGSSNTRQGRLYFTVCGHACQGDANLADNVWHHAAATFDGESLKLYVDGQLQKQVTAWRGEIPASGQDLMIGMKYASYSPNEKGVAFEGLLDEIVVFNRGLSEAEIKNVVTSTKPKFTRQQVERRLAELKDLYDRGLLLQDFYERKVKECEVEQ